MIEILASPDNVVAMKASGTMDGAEYDRILAVVEDRLTRHRRIGVVAEMEQFHGLTVEAVWKDFQYIIKRINQWDRFPRCALVTDEPWLISLATFWNPLIPGVELKVFKPGATTEAITWATTI